MAVKWLTGTTVWEERTLAGMVGRVTRMSSASGSQMALGWLGGLPSGRTYSAADLDVTDPFREHAEYDGFGRRAAWEYTAIDSPVGAYAQTYCDGGSVDPDRCSRPLLRIDAVRDQMGRIARRRMAGTAPDSARTARRGRRCPSEAMLGIVE